MSASRRNLDSGPTWEVMAGYSRAGRVGSTIHVSGTTATDADGELVGGEDPAAQARYAIEKIERAIKSLGGELTDVVRTRVYVSNIANWEPVARVHGEFFGEIRPANTLVEAKLVGPQYLVEIEAEAIVETEDAWG